MKKTYINPAMIAVKIHISSLMDNTSIGLGDAGSANLAESRGNTDWDDEE